MEDPTYNQLISLEVNLIKLKKNVVEDILVKRELIMRGHQRKEFLMKWRGLRDEETSWEKEDDLSKFKELIKAFHVIDSRRMLTN